MVAWLLARSQRARFLVRIEDLDPQRSRQDLERGQLADLRALGIDWDEPAVHQSERMALYDDALRQLETQGRLYPCFCTRAEIRQAASAPHGELPEGAYPGTCRSLSQAERRALRDRGAPSALRLRAHEEQITFNDRLAGPHRGIVDDFVVRRADGVPAYQLAVVVDDAAQGIGEVVRGADLLLSTPRQILLARLLRLAIPAFAHVPLVLGPDGARLAKRHGATTLVDRREPVTRTLAQLAHSLAMAGDREHVGSVSELLAEFDPGRLPRSAVVMDSQLSAHPARSS